MKDPNTGRFTWHELMTTDAKAATAFYAALFGWRVQEMDMGPAGTYSMLFQGEAPVGGAMTAPPGAPSAWLTYVGTDDTDATAAKITELGGTLMVPPTVVPGMVHFAIAADPQGAAFGVVKDISGQPIPPRDGPPAPGTFCWDELYAKDQEAAGKFYGALFGWTGFVGEEPMKYWHWRNEGKDIGGMMALEMLGKPGVPPHWLAYIAASDVEGSTAKVKELGGNVLMDTMDIPKVGKFSVVQDPTGAVFALFRSARM
jgi:predicted enzyme related to lactoylglutathione lyase